ncbi:large conductance mechanosensitive channel protein MscL [Myceligenerans salitolerans]|uniref:Large-conductance mechanosensitive channel n=1 Tax=Myceligenerans salitolerans TaxID=1230528 RepID=A0ABS3IBG2_9MICO|nr:large conductance mechanosensitive channel protein MscL [Myceligenerans salitolerans]MBO0609392.1 large conductance mechanosensitive channel protein MscL [Myceligenerans salitolerans]
MRTLNGFKDFITRGNVVDLAVAVIIGAAFTGVVTGLMDGVLNPLIAWLFGSPDVSSAGFSVTNWQGEETLFPIGLFLQSLINFVIVAAALYFFVVTPVKKLMELRRTTEEELEETLEKDVELLTEIRDLLRAQATTR